MEKVVIRFGEIGSKSAQVRSHMVDVLRQRVEDRLDYEGISYESVSRIPSRILIHTDQPEEAAEEVAFLPGVRSCSPAYETEPDPETIKDAVDRIEIGRTFGIDTSRSGQHEFDSMEINSEIGSFVNQNYDTEVDLDNPETWIKIDLREDRAFIYTDNYQGPDGFPVGTQGEMAALISGGIDSPVAAYEMMKRGADITPIYFYNRPVASEDHLLRFQSVIQRLEKFHPSKKWYYYRVDMQEINEKIMDIDQGRMIVHRRLMFRIAEKIAEKQNLDGLVTGESVGQKSSQTGLNLEKTTEAVSMPVHRPLLTTPKSEITATARKIGTMKESNIKSACTTISPPNPATELKERQLHSIENKLDIEELVDSALDEAEKNRL